MAWEEFKQGKLKKIEVEEFEFNLESNLFAVQQELRNKTYSPKAYSFFYVRDPKLRPIHKASVRDRVVFQAVSRILYHSFDRQFIYDTYACRFDKGNHKGVRRLEEFIRKASRNYHRPVFILKCDVRKFFYNIDHAILLELVRPKVADPDALDLIQKIIGSFCVQPCKGLPLGNVTSQLFANVYLNEFDQYVKHVLKEKYYIRYCDDFVIVGTDYEHLNSLISKTDYFLQTRLRLSLHPKKVEIRKLSQGIDFLGYVILPNYRILRTTTKRRMIRRVCQDNVHSYLGLLRHCKGYRLEQTIKSLFPEIFPG